MQRIHKILAICLLMTALVFGVLKILGGVGHGAKGKEAKTPSSRDSMTRHERGEKASDASTRKFRPRVRKLTADEAKELLKTIIISEINFENITLEDALKIANEEIAKQIPEGQPRPRIMLDPEYLALTKRLTELHPDDLLGDSGSFGQQIIDELRLRNVPVLVLVKFICDKTNTRFKLYKGDVLVGLNVSEENPSIILYE